MLTPFRKSIAPRLLVALASMSLALGLLCSYASAESEKANLRNFKYGEKLPSFTLDTLGGQGRKTFTPGAGKPSLIIFFSIRPEFRQKRSLALLSAMATMVDQYKNRIEIVGVFSDDQGAQVVTDYIKPFANKITVYADTNKEVNDRYGAFMMPLAVMITSDGKLHEVIPYTYNIRELIDGNFKLLLGDWNKEQLQASLVPAESTTKSESEKEYIRRVNYGKIMQGKQMFSQAAREFSTAIKIMPQDISAYLELGYTYVALKDWSKAEESFQKALTIDKESDGAIAGLGLSYYGKGDIDRALPELENAFIAPEPRLEVIIALAEIYEKKGDNTKANRLNKLAISRLMTLYDQRWK
ncbi:MAG: tetratricopeptide repeat protein [Desulfobulbaceae bacterium]|nr:tetratricopeptide repeat protein [Desulfobulbaceae bacterium]